MKRRDRANPGIPRHLDQAVGIAAGVDIACRMRLSVFDLPARLLRSDRDRLAGILMQETVFGQAMGHARPPDHPVMDADWNVSPVTQQVRDRARAQLGSSGSGNHFVEFGAVSAVDGAPEDPRFRPGQAPALALLSHSGSRGAGARVCDFYTKRAVDRRPHLDGALKRLAWLDLDEPDGREYVAAMELMGAHAHANHEIIHHRIARALGASIAITVENHHNFAWMEEVDGERLVVHRKGATPAHAGCLGIIPGSMASPAYIVRGRGDAASLHSAGHGAGRLMSRTEARRRFTWSAARRLLAGRDVTLLSAGLDEVPFAYRDIDQVMAAQRSLVDTLGRFDPAIVRMAPDGEAPED